MLKDKRLLSCYLFFFVYFFCIGLTTYSGKFFGEIGLSDAQIGLINAMPAIAAIFVQPIFGSLVDRAKLKKNVLTGTLLIASAFAFLVNPASGSFWPLLAVLTLMNIFTLPIIGIGTTISIDYTQSVGRDFGPVRMMGTVGYEVVILSAGFLFGASLKGLYFAYAFMLIVSALASMLLPPVQGYQRDQERISFTVFFKDRTLLLLFGIVFVMQLCSQFYLSFFSKHLGDLGLSNSLTGIITVLSVILEIPFLFFGDKIMKKLSIWKWFIIGLIANGIRFVALGFATTPAALIAAQIPTVTMLAIFEFYPMIYLNNAVSKELRGTVQSTYQLVAFGISRIVSSLIGGLMANAFGIDMVFRFNGFLLLTAAAVLFVPLMHKAKAEGR